MDKKNQTTIIETLGQLFIEDIDIKDAKINQFINAKVINIILNNTETEKRMEIYSHLMVGNIDDAKSKILKEIPNLKEQLYEEIKKYI